MTTPITPEQARELADHCEHAQPTYRALRSLAAQVEALTADRNQQQGMVEKCMIEINRNADLGQAAEKKCDELRADAERYRWVRNKAFKSDWDVCAYKSAEYVDAYIDAARAAS